MAIGIVTDEEFEDELTDELVEIKELNIGRGEQKEVPNSLRKIIGEESIKEGHKNGTELAKQFGISSSSVSAYAKGATSTSSYHEPNEELKEHIDNSKNQIAVEARSKLLSSLAQITEEKLSGAKVRDLAGVAKDMSAIVKNTEQIDSENSGVQFVFLVPPKRKEESFEVIDVKE